MLFSKTNMAGNRTQMCTRTAEMQSPSEKNENVLPHPKGWEEKVRNVRLRSCSLLVNQRMDWLWTGGVWSTTHPCSVLCFSVCVCIFTLQDTGRGVNINNTHKRTERRSCRWQVSCRTVSFPFPFPLSHSV